MSDVSITSCVVRHVDDRFRVEVIVANRGERPAFVLRGLHHVDVDTEHDRITLRWAAAPEGRGGAAPGERRETSVPATRPVDPGGEVSLVAELHESLSRPVVDDKGAVSFTAVDLDDVDEVAVVVAAGDAPFYFNPGTGGDIEAQLRGWGTEVSRTVDWDGG